MKHPLRTLENGTEITVSSLKDGKIRVCTEYFDKEMDRFKTTVISVPDGTVLFAEGYTENEVAQMVQAYTERAEWILDFVRKLES